MEVSINHAHLALVRAYDGEPLKRVIVATGPDVFYVANPRCLHAIRTGRSQPIGFRFVDCFAWDQVAFERLSEAYVASGQTETDAWIALPLFAGSPLRLR